MLKIFFLKMEDPLEIGDPALLYCLVNGIGPFHVLPYFSL